MGRIFVTFGRNRNERIPILFTTILGFTPQTLLRCRRVRGWGNARRGARPAASAVLSTAIRAHPN